MKLNLSTRLGVVLPVLILFEFAFLEVTYGNIITNSLANALCFSGTSLLIALFTGYSFYGKQIELLHGKATSRDLLIFIAVFTGLFVVCNMEMISALKHFAYREKSDIIPMIEVLCKRFLAGKDPYGTTEAVNNIQHSAPSTYLPMHWLPSLLPAYFGFDYRTMAFAVFVFISGILGIGVLKSSGLKNGILALLVSLGMLYLITLTDPQIPGVTLEITYAGYYMLLMAAFQERRPVLIAVTITLCLLSRYYIALWIPFYAVILLMAGAGTKLFKTLLWVGLMVSLLYVLPFLSRNWSALTRPAGDYYLTVPLGEWMHTDKFGRPYHLYYGVGFAFLFREGYLHDLPAGIALLFRTLMVSIAVAFIGTNVWYWRHRAMLDHRIFLMVSFKIFLTVFHAFIVIPYKYLLITSVFVSVGMYVQVLRYRVKRELS